MCYFISVCVCILYRFNCTESIQASYEKFVKNTDLPKEERKIYHPPALEIHHSMVSNLFQILNPFENLLGLPWWSSG